MESTMVVVDRLIDGMHGEDPGGARLYMSHLREHETLLMLECFEDMLSGRLPVTAPSSSGDPAPLSGSGGGSMAYRVPPSEFFKVLVEGNTTRLGALHAVMKAIGRGDLQGRAASLCISELRMCLSTFSDNTEVHDGGRRITSIQRRISQLRELAGICLSFSMDTPSVARRPVAGIYAGGRRGTEDANNRRVLMLEALPAVLEACCAVAIAEAEDGDNSDDGDSSESESDEGEGYEEPLFAEDRKRGGGAHCVAADGASTAADTAGVVAAARGKKQKGKGKPEWECESGSRRGADTASGRIGNDAGGCILMCAGRQGCTRQSSDLSQRALPERGETILRDVTDALLDRPWPLRLVLPLLVVFEEIFELVELLGRQANGEIRQAPESGSGAIAGKESVWARVRARLMEVVRMGGLDGADFTGVVRQVCILCDADSRQDYEHDARPSLPPGKGLSGGNVTVEAGTVHQQGHNVLLANGRGEEAGGFEKEQGTQARAQVGGRTTRRSWLSCLRQLYAAVPAEWISTVELVLEQTLHQMPGVAESLLDAIQDAGSSTGVDSEAWGGIVSDTTVVSSQREGRHTSGGPHDPAPGADLGSTSPASISNDLALLILLLREASPLRACSLPLLPFGVDRGRRAEEGVRRLFLQAARCDLEGRSEIASVSGGKNRIPGRGGASGGTRALVRAVLCLEPRLKVGVGGSGNGGRGDGGSSSSCNPISTWGSGSSGVASERASQLLELALRWLEEGDGRNSSGGNVGALHDKERGGAELDIRDIACEMISEVFDVVVEARPRLVRALLSGVFDKSQGGEACAWSYMRAWEALMAQEAEQECRRLLSYSQGVADALGRLTLLPRGRARRIVESILPLADVCPTQAAALVSLCRKCSVQGDGKGRLLTLHAVTCILAWNARRARSGRKRRDGGCLDQEGAQEDLVGMFRRAFDGGLQSAARADALHLLASKLATPAVEDASPCTTFRGTCVAGGTHPGDRLPQAEHFDVPLRSPMRAVLDPEPSLGIDLTALGGLREFLAMRLFRFFAHKDEVLGADSNGVVENDGDDRAGAGRYGRGSTDRQSRGKGKGKGKQRARRRRGGRFQLVPLRLLEERGSFSKDHSLGTGSGRSKGHVIARKAGRGVIPRDAIGQLMKCCWALVPDHEGSTATASPGGANERVVPGLGKRAEAEAIARAVLGARKRRRDDGEAREGGRATPGVYTREGEALVAVVEFLQGGGCMETLPMVAPPKQDTPGHQEADNDVSPPLVPPPPSCNPQSVSPLAALGVVVTLAEALVDCLLSGISCLLVATPSSRPEPPLCAGSQSRQNNGCHVASNGEGDSVSPPPAHDETPPALWAVADLFTLLAAATRAADSIAESNGGIPRQTPARAPESLSEMIVSLPAETLGLRRGSEPFSEVVVTEEDEENEGGGATEERNGCIGEPGFVDEVGRLGLLSESSALVFVKEFLEWAAQDTGESPASLVAEGWDGGIGVWLGLLHSVRTLMRTFNTTGSRGSCTRGHGVGDGVNSPSAEDIAVAVFQLRAVVGTPSAALHVLDPSAVPSEASRFSNGLWYASPCLSSPDDGAAAPSESSVAEGAIAAGSSASRRVPCRPPAGTMIRGFLKGMSERWKAALPWSLPGSAPPRRASPRLGRRYHRRDGGEGSGHSNTTESLKAEAEDLFFALRGELLRAERFVLSTLLVGPHASLAGRAWTMRAALASARPGRGEETANGCRLEGLRSTSRTVTAAPNACCDGAAGPPRASRAREDPPEAGSGPARAAPCAVVWKTAASNLGKISPRTSVAEGQETLLELRRSGGKHAEKRGRCMLTAGATSSEDGQDGMWDGLGRLCCFAATEMREGLETGLSVKLSQAYLDLIELLGNAALDHRDHARPAPAANTADLAAFGAAASQYTFAGTGSTQSNCILGGGDREREDAGGVLLSIVTCHTISQHKLFKRVVRGAVRFNGIGVERCLKAPRNAASSLEELQGRDKEISFPVGRHGGGTEVDLSATVPCKGANTTVRRQPVPLERSSRLLVHCVRWIRVRHKGKHGRASIHAFEQDESSPSEEEEEGEEEEGIELSGKGLTPGLPGEGKGDGEEASTEVYACDGPQSRYSSRPEDVKFASSRECLAAVRTALVECETVLSSVGGTDVACGDGGTSADSELADVLATVAPGLREFFAPAVVTPTPTLTAYAAKCKTAKNDRGSNSAAAAAVVGPASPPPRAGHRGEQEKTGGKNAIRTAGGAPHLAALDVFPDTVKLLLMRVLERMYLVGKGATVTASAVLAKPSSTAVATVAGARSVSPSPPKLPPMPSPCPSSSLPSKRRRRQREVATNASRPGDQAGGAPVKAPAKRNKAIVLASGGRSSRSQSKSQQSSTTPRSGKGTLQGGGDLEADVAWGARSKQRASRPGVAVANEDEEPVNSLLAPVLPAVALASGHCLRLMLEARMWAEALRSTSRRAGDDPCKKRASTMLFKIERCELEIATAAQKARQFLKFFDNGAQKSPVEAEKGGPGGVVGGSRKRGRASVGHAGSENGGIAQGKTDPGSAVHCDDKVETALRLLVSGADTIAAWRRESAAKAKSKDARPQRGGKRGQTRHGQQEGGPAGDDGEERLAGGRANCALDRFSGASGKRRRSSGRIRSRNVVIDGWLEEGGEEGGSRGDAFVDLEDFIEA